MHLISLSVVLKVIWNAWFLQITGSHKAACPGKVKVAYIVLCNSSDEKSPFLLLCKTTISAHNQLATFMQH